jgi:hypothetical protein
MWVDGIWRNNVPKFETLFPTLSSLQILNIKMNNEWKSLNKCNNNFNVVKAHKAPNKKKGLPQFLLSPYYFVIKFHFDQ